MLLCLLNRGYLSWFCLYFALQFRVNIINILLPCRIVIQKCFSMRLGRAPPLQKMALGYCDVCFFVVLESAFSLFSASSSTIWPSIVLTLMGLLFLMYVYIMSRKPSLSLLKLCIQPEYMGTK